VSVATTAPSTRNRTRATLVLSEALAAREMVVASITVAPWAGDVSSSAGGGSGVTSTVSEPWPWLSPKSSAVAVKLSKPGFAEKVCVYSNGAAKSVKTGTPSTAKVTEATATSSRAVTRSVVVLPATCWEPGAGAVNVTLGGTPASSVISRYWPMKRRVLPVSP
jgi:hypothetical protein